MSPRCPRLSRVFRLLKQRDSFHARCVSEQAFIANRLNVAQSRPSLHTAAHVQGRSAPSVCACRFRLQGIRSRRARSCWLSRPLVPRFRAPRIRLAPTVAVQCVVAGPVRATDLMDL